MDSNTTKLDRSREIISALRRINLRPRSYSGRFMYGKECVGVVIDRYRDSEDLLFELAGEFDEGFELPRTSSDSMGLGQIIYWPSLPWPEDESE